MVPARFSNMKTEDYVATEPGNVDVTVTLIRAALVGGLV